MMRKGIYSATIAFTAIVLAVAIIANTGQRISLDEESSYYAAMVEVKRQWQNSSYVLDKAASDAMADSVLGNGCSYNEPDIATNVQAYFQELLGQNGMWKGECNHIDALTVDAANQNNIAIEIIFACEKDFGEKLSVNYKKQALFNKAVGITSTVPCIFTVKDNLSGLDEVTYP